jgi:hypothetical protein
MLTRFKATLNAGRFVLSRTVLTVRVATVTVLAVIGVNLRAMAAHAGTVIAQVEMEPTSSDFPGGTMVQKIVNWAGQFGLWGSICSLLVGAGIWGISQHFGNGYQAGKGKILAAAGGVGAVLTGLAPIIVNTLFNAASA